MSVLDALIPRLPPELVDHIIDHLYDDKVTLDTLTTVCSTFLPTASLHLFHHVSVDIGRKSIQDFTDFLRDAPPRIGHNIKQLAITSDPRTEMLGWWTRQKLPIAALASLLPHLPHLSDLCVKSVNLESIAALPDAIPRSLDRLSLTCVQAAGGPVDICVLLTLFSEIRSLHIESATWIHLHRDPTNAAREIDAIQQARPLCLFPSTKVTNLDMGSPMFTRHFLEILRRTKTAGSLELINAICFNMLEVWSLGDFLAQAGQSVKHLTFNLARLYEDVVPELPDHVWRCLALDPNCPALETLTLKLKVDLLNDGVTAVMFCAATCLLQHVPPSLRNVVIQLALPLSIYVPRPTRTEQEIIRFVDKEMSLEWSYLAFIAQSFPSYTLQLIWATGPVHYPDIAEVLTSIVRKKIPDCKICFTSSATTVF